MNSILGIISDGASSERLESLAWMSLPIIQHSPASVDSDHFVLIVSPLSLHLQATGKKVPGPVSVDFVEGKNRHRRLFGGGKNQLIAKAVGIKSAVRPRILDLTAGLGEDAFVLASLGCNVAMVERSPVVYALLHDGLQRALSSGDTELLAIVNRLSLTHQDAKAYLSPLADCLDQQFDVIYLDPMFPKLDKTAAVNKAMSSFKKIVGADDDAGQLLKLALASNAKRVVVKRPRKGATIPEQYPDLMLPEASLQLSGKSSRYDIYPVRSLKSEAAVASLV